MDVPNNLNYDLYVFDQAWGLKWTSTNGAGIDELLTKKVVVKGMYYYVKVVPAISTQYSLSSNYILKVRQYSANEYYGALGWSYPTTGLGSTTITSTFGNTGTRYHKGIDLGVSYQPVFATETGTILHSRVYSTGEKAIAIKTNSNDPNTDNNIIVRYLHLNSMSVSTGNIVSKGQQIGVSGNTGSSTGPHLHLDTNNKLMEYPGDYDTFNPKYFWPTTFGITTFNMSMNIEPHDDSIFDNEEHSFDTLLIEYLGETTFYGWFHSLEVQDRTQTNLKKYFNITDEQFNEIMSVK